MKKKIVFFVIASCLILSFTACGNNAKTEESTTKKYEIAEYSYEVSSNWEVDNSNADTTYFYPEEGMLMVAYSETSENLSDDATRKSFIDSFGATTDSFEILSESTTEVAGQAAYEFKLNINSNDINWDSTMINLNTSDGILMFLMSVKSDSDTNYDNDFSNILSSVKNANGSATAGRAEKEKSDTVNENDIEVTAVPTQDGLICLFIKNNSKTTIGALDVQINYKDESGQTIDSDEDGHDVVLPGSTIVSRMEAPDSYVDFEIIKDIRVDDNKKYENHFNQLSVTSNQGDKCIILEIANNSDVTIEELEYIAVLYSGNDIVTVEYPEDIYDLESGKTITEKIDTFSEQYDRFEIYINQAHTFGL
ncbi:hypothetical protein DWW31_14110 [Clostridium sp. AF15-17LB]|nr:hypothetical protein DWW31_14110 [Clostridium sp. AF15-17LB]